MMKDTATGLRSDFGARLSAAEERLRDLARQFDGVIDIRATVGAESSSPLMDWALARIHGLTEQLRAREGVADWDEVDDLTARVLIEVLALAVAELRRNLNAGGTMLATAEEQLRNALHVLDRVERESSSRADPESFGT
jgi:hypothetical protein